MEANLPAKPKPKSSEHRLFILSMAAMLLGMAVCGFGIWLMIPILGVGPILLSGMGLGMLGTGYLMNPWKEDTD